jgi:hypothetical protein
MQRVHEQACRSAKAVAWHSDGRSSSNDWKTLNRNVALQDREQLLVFQPSAAEVHRHAGEGFQKQESYRWSGENLDQIREPSFRYYVRAGELKAAGMDWTEALAAEAENLRARLAAEILASSSYSSTMDRARAFVQQGGGCRARFFNYRRRLGNGIAEKLVKSDG